MKPYQTQEATTYSNTRTSWPEVVGTLLKYVKNSNFLDAGCGTGNDLFALYEHTGLVGYACDYSLDMIEEARKKVPDASFRQVNLDEAFPYDRIFDVIYNHDVLQHLKKPEVFISNAYKHLNSNGYLIIANEFSQGLKEKFTSIYFPSALIIDQKRYHNKLDIISLLQKSGFSLADTIEIHDTEIFTSQILAQVRTKSHSILRLLNNRDYKIGLKMMESDLQSGKLTHLVRNYTILIAKK